MSAWLLDINVLIARQDADHEHHARASQWLNANAAAGWATCPVTENGFVRILGQPSYPGWPGTPEAAAKVLRGLIASIPGHRFLPDEISLLDHAVFPSLQGVGARAVTDLYLLALAVHHGVRFATLDSRINPALIAGGPATYELLAP